MFKFLFYNAHDTGQVNSVGCVFIRERISDFSRANTYVVLYTRNGLHVYYRAIVSETNPDGFHFARKAAQTTNNKCCSAIPISGRVYLNMSDACTRTKDIMKTILRVHGRPVCT